MRLIILNLRCVYINTDQVFGLCYLLGFRFAPRLRDLGDRKLYSIEAPTRYPNLDLLMGGTINTKQITDQWDELREKYLHNQIFSSLDLLEEQLCQGLNAITTDTEQVRSLMGFPHLKVSV